MGFQNYWNVPQVKLKTGKGTSERTSEELASEARRENFWNMNAQTPFLKLFGLEDPLTTLDPSFPAYATGCCHHSPPTPPAQNNWDGFVHSYFLKTSLVKTRVMIQFLSSIPLLYHHLTLWRRKSKMGLQTFTWRKLSSWFQERRLLSGGHHRRMSIGGRTTGMTVVYQLATSFTTSITIINKPH